MTTGTVVKRNIIRSRGKNQRVVGKIVGAHYIESCKRSATEEFQFRKVDMSQRKLSDEIGRASCRERV